MMTRVLLVAFLAFATQIDATAEEAMRVEVAVKQLGNNPPASTLAITIGTTASIEHGGLTVELTPRRMPNGNLSMSVSVLKTIANGQAVLGAKTFPMQPGKAEEVKGADWEVTVTP